MTGGALGRVAMRSCAVISIALLIVAYPRGVTGERPAHAFSQADTEIRTTIVASSRDSTPVSGATVQIVQTDGQFDRTMITGASGTATFRKIPAGRYTIVVAHPLLDSAGLVVQDSLVVAKDKSAAIRIPLYSRREIAGMLCGNRSDSLPAIVGSILDSAGQARLTNAVVTVRWTPPAGDTTAGMRHTMPDSLGRYAVCGLPRLEAIAVTISADGHQSSGLLVQIAQGALGTFSPQLRGLHELDSVQTANMPDSLKPKRLASDSTRAGTTIRGVVRTPAGGVVAGARVVVEDAGGLVAVTDSSGAFVLRGLTRGVHTLVVRALQRKPQRLNVETGDHDEWKVTFVLDAVALPSVTVSARAAELERLGFLKRQREIEGGIFFTAEDLESYNAPRIDRVLGTLSHLKLTREGSMFDELGPKNAGDDGICWWVDGRRMSDPELKLQVTDRSVYQEIKQFYPIHEIVAVEVYPPDVRAGGFTRLPMGTCQAIVIWTKWYTGEIMKRPAKRDSTK
jgi:hypothetical protein